MAVFRCRDIQETQMKYLSEWDQWKRYSSKSWKRFLEKAREMTTHLELWRKDIRSIEGRALCFRLPSRPSGRQGWGSEAYGLLFPLRQRRLEAVGGDFAYLLWSSLQATWVCTQLKPCGAFPPRMNVVLVIVLVAN